ncbi:MAG: carboxymuconolactone decarboxylase family protein [Acidimicrobiia bacterium]
MTDPRKVDAKTKGVIAFTVAAINGCDFCLNAPTAGLRRHGYDDEAIAEILGTLALWHRGRLRLPATGPCGNQPSVRWRCRRMRRGTGQ